MTWTFLQSEEILGDLGDGMGRKRTVREEKVKMGDGTSVRANMIGNKTLRE